MKINTKYIVIGAVKGHVKIKVYTEITNPNVRGFGGPSDWPLYEIDQETLGL